VPIRAEYINQDAKKSLAAAFGETKQTNRKIAMRTTCAAKGARKEFGFIYPPAREAQGTKEKGMSSVFPLYFDSNNQSDPLRRAAHCATLTG
jgi:hypothetical protein